MISINKLLSKKYISNWCLDEDIITSETETFEEYPLVFSDDQRKNWEELFPNVNVFFIWIYIAVFLMDFYYILNKNKKLFIWITIDNFENIENSKNPDINLFVSTVLDENDFLNNLIEKKSSIISKEMKFVISKFDDAGILKRFAFYESRFFDKQSETEILRVYCVPERN